MCQKESERQSVCRVRVCACVFLGECRLCKHSETHTLLCLNICTCWALGSLNSCVYRALLRVYVCVCRALLRMHVGLLYVCMYDPQHICIYKCIFMYSLQGIIQKQRSTSPCTQQCASSSASQYTHEHAHAQNTHLLPQIHILMHRQMPT